MPGIGTFAIGSSQIGSEPFDWLSTVLSQYANSRTINNILQSFSLWFDETVNIDNFYDYVWNVDTAQGFGLDIWGRIVGIGRTWPIAVNTEYFQFDGGDGEGFNLAPFWSGNVQTTNFTFSDDAYRRLILAKAYSNIIDCTIPSLNQLLANMFPGRGNCYVLDNADMSFTYYFGFPLSNIDLTIITNTGILPRPGGISVNVVHS